MVERVTSNDEVAGSIPSEGIQASWNNLLHFFLVVMVFMELLELFCNVVRLLAGSLAWSFSELRFDKDE